MAYDTVDQRTVYLCTGQPLPEDIKQIVEWMLSEDFMTAYQSKGGERVRERGGETERGGSSPINYNML